MHKWFKNKTGLSRQFIFKKLEEDFYMWNKRKIKINKNYSNSFF